MCMLSRLGLCSSKTRLSYSRPGYGNSKMESSCSQTPKSSSKQSDLLVGRIMSARSHYDVLGGVSKQSSDDDIKRAYRTLALKTHPDKNNHDNAEEAFKRVQGAFEALETQDKRDLYQRKGGIGLSVGEEDDDHDHSGPFSRRGGGGGMDFPFPMAGGGGMSMNDFIMMMMMEEMMFGGRDGFHSHFHEDYVDEDDEGDDDFVYNDEYGAAYYGEYDEDNAYYDEDYDDDYDDEVGDFDIESFDVKRPNGLVFNTYYNQFICRLCDVKTTTELDMEGHVRGKKHVKAVALQRFTTETRNSARDKRKKADDPDVFVCEICDLKVSDLKSFQSHLAGKKHSKAMETERREAKANKNAGKT